MGDAKIYSALISGFNATTTNPTTAGWTTITGTTLAGQDATHYFIIDNGEERIILDSTPVVLGQAGCNVYTFAAGVWQFSYVCNNLGAFTVSNIDTNNGKQVRVRVNVVTNISTPQTAQYTITMNRDVPIADFFVTGRTGNPQVADFNFLCSRNSSGLPFSKTIYALGGQATDIYGFTGTPTLIDVDGPMVVPVPSQGQDLIIGLNKSTGSTVNVTGSGVILVPGGAPPFHMYLGYTPRTYTPHSTINTLIGNSDGQFIEADYYNAWEGVTPFVAATNLLTNGTFETDTTGWTNNGGTWARVTTQKKFGTASVQGSSANGVFSQQVSGLTVGAKYSASAWVRTVDATAGNAAITFGTAATSGTVGTTPTLTFGKEWSLLTAIWTATQTSIFIRLSIDVSGVGNFQFDGVTMYTVVDSSGNKKLSFQTTDATQWAVGTNASGITTLTSPRGSGIQFTTSAQFGNIKTDFQSQDFSRYRYVNLWAKRISGSGDLNLFFRTAAGASTGQTGTTIPSMTTLWQFFTLDFGTQQSNAGWTSAGNIYIESANAAGTFAIANISVSQRNMSAGNKHGLINDFEETAPLAWWKLDELSGSGSELLTNPGFETYTTTPGIPDSWINNGLPSTNDAEKETTIKRSGSNSVKITINDNDGGTDGIAQDFSVTNGSSYYIEAWVQTGGAYVAKLLLTGHGGGGTITSATGGNSSAFSKLSMTFKATATGTARLYLVDAVNATGHIFYWDDISIKSITAGDASGNGGNGILSGAANTAGPTINATGKINTGYDFDGVDDYILATIPSLNPSITGASLEAWLKPSTVAAGVAVASNFQGSTLPYIGRSGAAATLSWFDSAAVQQSISGGTLTAGQYSHVVATLAGTTVTLFINGVQVAQNTATTLRNLASVSYALGGALGFPSNAWAGTIDESRVYNRALGPDEVVNRFNQTVHELSGWRHNGSTMFISQSTDKKEGTYALTTASTATDSQIQIEFPIPMDFTGINNLQFWTKQSSSDPTYFRLGNDTSNFYAWNLTGSTSYQLNTKSLSSPDSTTGSPDLTRVSFMLFGGMDTGITYFIDAMSLNNLSGHTGQYLWNNASGASLYSVKNISPVLNDVYPFFFTTSAIGKYMFGVMAKSDAGTPQIDIAIDGVTYTGTPVTIPTNTMAIQQTQLMFGPIDINSVGNHTLNVKVTTLSSMTQWDIDFVAMYPYKENTSTPINTIFPYELGRNALKGINY